LATPKIGDLDMGPKADNLLPDFILKAYNNGYGYYHYGHSESNTHGGNSNNRT